ncbi:MAG: sulfur carrier protein ThiS [Gammaproteobacteria bacterium]|nr:sulfur carrier protein ThiS [Gammaproteobacteria bacterium]MCY4219533.1 sulfur carrier protein ThiS [Gammaproteobacteria bacterium]
MRIIINGKTRKVSNQLLSEILIECGYQQTHFATALNGAFIHKHLRESTRVMPGDRIEVVTPNAGG